MKANLKVYKIGLGVLAVFAIVLTVIVLLQAAATKQDAKTNNEANNIANSLNSYVDDNEVIPDSLTGAGIHNVPPTISYQKLSDSEYKFCVSYKSTSSGFDATGTVTNLVLTGQLDSNYDNYSDNSDLYISNTYHKGVNCQSVSPSWVSLNQGNSNTANASTVSPNLCGYQVVEKSCQESCTNSNETSNTQTIYDGTVSKVAEDGTDEIFTIDVYGTASTAATSYQIVSNSNTQAYDSECNATESSTITSGDEIRVDVSGTPTIGTTAKLEANYIIDFDE